ncbi:thioester reductase-like protein/short-subunit dehydrogenase involved in D-alanine esterification of teichoic acids [Actinokineospora baliensis]|uniref:SDR family oxidoreductase n=1 Tax=Actinokineospora baliensis TaxID=547056 RepID=UPI00195B59E6|nr:SDR family oxidoreductase [Actinokineospora baliensis]MBM7772396.1 thioester reductase-like protein/short-subunit dehydrogenase involved in D-alanine esterification of teichoic acids [Actinokineospora baliensis]
MATYFVTGATGFLGRRLVERLVARAGTSAVYVLVRQRSMDRFAEASTRWGRSDLVVPVVGDLAEAGLGVDLPHAVDQVVHLGAVYDFTAPAEDNERANVAGTRHALEFAAAVGAGVFHHVSSIAVAGDHRGRFTERDFDLGQRHHSPYHATKFAAERLVREQDRVPYRVYRPAAVVGDSRTGEMDKVDGLYYFLPALTRLARLPRALPLVLPDLGGTNVVPVDYVVDAMVHLMHADAPSGSTYHLTHNGKQPVADVFNALAKAIGAPQIRATLPITLPKVRAVRPVPAAVLNELGVPGEVLPHMDLPTVFDSTATVEALDGITLPDFATYADVLVSYWSKHLDPERHQASSLRGRRIVVTGASSGIGRETALMLGDRGATVLLVARRQAELEEVREEIERAGGTASTHPCDLTDSDAVDALVKELGVVDMLVNNAGRSIRRAVHLSVDRLHDYERTMALNYFAPLRLTLGLLPGMRARGFGRIVNVTTMGLQTDTPRFSAYLASKAALEAFGRAAGRELLTDGVTVCAVRMPLVRTPMIGATDAYKGVPATSPKTAAKLVVRALTNEAEVVQRPEGLAMELLRVVAPGLARQVLNIAYRLTGESAPEARTRPERPLPVLATALVRPLWRGLRR